MRPEQPQAFNEKKALIDATALAQLDSEGEFLLDTDARDVVISLESCTKGKVFQGNNASEKIVTAAKNYLQLKLIRARSCLR